MVRKEDHAVGSSFITCEICGEFYEYRSARQYKGKHSRYCPDCAGLSAKERLDKWNQNQMRIENLAKSSEEQN